ncbi:MAG TPA: thiosulfate oxidation carrier complex protein SoxZ [Burkholderiaceae bacterium]|nr:thiosulfate oxidation carrier complex protein SoxZ [Burkholderiaceae bacterium]
MGDPMKIKAALADGVTEVKVLMRHPMETGLRKDESGAPVPAWFITEVTATHGDRVVLRAQFGTSVSRNPYLAFRFKGGQVGDRVTVSWVDSKGDRRSDEATIG